MSFEKLETHFVNQLIILFISENLDQIPRTTVDGIKTFFS